MYVCHILKSPQKYCTVDARRRSSCDVVGGFCAIPCRRRRGGLCDVATDPRAPAHFLGARPAVCERGRSALSAGGGAAFCDGASVTPGRGFNSDGGRPARGRACGGGGRGLGRAIKPRFYRNAAAGAAGRGDGCGVLVDPARGHPRPECRAQPLAGGIAAVCTARPRPACTGRCALAGGFVPVAVCRPRHMGGAL